MFKSGPHRSSFSPREQLILQPGSLNHSKMGDNTAVEENSAEGRDQEAQKQKPCCLGHRM